MKFLKVNPQLALNLAKIEQLVITGTEGTATVRIEAVMDGGDSVVISRHKDFRAAETALLDLVGRLEGE